MKEKGQEHPVQVDTSPERLGRVWRGVEAKLESERSSRRRYGIAAATAAAAWCALWLLGSGGPSSLATPPPVPAAITAESAAAERSGHHGPDQAIQAVEPVARPSVIALEDGRVELAANSRVELIQDQGKIVGVKLISGHIDCDLEPKPDRRFTVDAAGVQVKVKGTRFSVALTEEDRRVEVAVERGLVEVLKPGASSGARQLGAGEFWSTKVEPNRGGAQAQVAAPTGAQHQVVALTGASRRSKLPARRSRATEQAEPAPLAVEPLQESKRSLAIQPAEGPSEHSSQRQVPLHPKPSSITGEHTETGESTDTDSVAPVGASNHTSASRDPVSAKPAQGEAPSAITARGLMTRANTARRQGNPKLAAQLYGKLLRQSPSDARAGLAAFELGRLQMDRLGNLAGAVKTLRRAMAIAPGSAFREDATARLVRAYAALGAQEQCKNQRAAYLRAYPTGVHRTSIIRTCDH